MNDGQFVGFPQGGVGHSLQELLGKDRREFTKADISKFVSENSVEMLNLRFVASDGRLKVLNVVASDPRQLDRILSAGERVDGSSLLVGIDPGASDVYVIPRYNTAFLNPFSHRKSVDVLCSFFTAQGEPVPCAPDRIVRAAHDSLKRATGCTMEALAELEYYIIGRSNSPYPATAQRGYGESGPFTKWERLREDAMCILSKIGYKVKYGHSEVGRIGNEDEELEQHEIEFNLSSLEESADAVVLGRWVLRMLSNQQGCSVTFAPKLVHGHAGSGLHVHARLMRDGKPLLSKADGLSETALKMIAGYLTCASSLTAFGNTIPVSYLRLVPNQEAPVYICWGERNRSSLVRIPLSWSGVADMAQQANPQDPNAHTIDAQNHTVEFRSPDGSANSHFLHAGLAVAARHGLTMENALEVARKGRVEVNIFKDPHSGVRATLPKLPVSCVESAAALYSHKELYALQDVFPAVVLDSTIERLRKLEDEDRLCRKADFAELNKLIAQYVHFS